MIARPIDERRAARRDIEDAVDHYLREGGASAATGFIDALESAYLQISTYPDSGALRYADTARVAELRCWTLRRYPYVVFYLEAAGRIDVVRVLHGRSDIPSWLGPVE